MFGKKFDFLVVMFLFFLFSAITASCAGQTPEVKTPPSQEPVNDQVKAEIDIVQIEVHEGDRIVFSGTTSLSEGACIESQLFEDGVPVGWWPSDACFLITGGNWEFAVFLGEDGIPENLDDSAQYQLQVWWAGAPEETVDAIYFDLAGPQSP